MTEQESLDLQKQGANARALGRSVFDNPYLKAENLPVKTGETVEEWSAKNAAWELGWRMEDAMRPSALDGMIADLSRR
jgi:hypothetical protein